MNCRECVRALPAFVNGQISSDDAERVNEHLLECERCFAAYVELIGAAWQVAGPGSGRVRLPVVAAMERFLDAQRELWRLVVDRVRAGGHVRLDERGSWQRHLVAARVAGALETPLVRAGLDPAVPIPDTPRRLVIDDASAIPYVGESWLLGSNPWFLTGPTVEWLNVDGPGARAQRLTLGGPSPDGLGRAVLARERFGTASERRISDAFFAACALGAIGMPVPVELLGKIADQDPNALPFLTDPLALFGPLEGVNPHRYVKPVSQEAALEALGETDSQKRAMLQEYQIRALREASPPLTLGVISRTAAQGQREHARVLSHESVVKQAMQGTQTSWQRLAWAKMLEGLGEYVEAHGRLEQALRDDPHNRYLRHAMGRLLHMMGEHDAAVEQLRSLAEDEPNNVFARQSLGRYLARQSPGRAREYLERAQELQPSNVHVLHARAMVEVSLGRFDAAEQYFSSALNVDADNVVVLGAWATMEAWRGRFEIAEQLYARAADIDPTNMRLLVAWAKLRKERGHLLPAQQLLERTLAAVWGAEDEDRFELLLKTSNVHVLTTLSDILVTRERLDEAEYWLKHALRLDRTPPVATAVLDLYVKAGRIDEARRWSDSLTAQEQQSPHVRAVRVVLQVATNGERHVLEAGASELERILAEDRTNAAVAGQLGKLLGRLGKLADARRLINSVLELSAADLPVIHRVAVLNTWAGIEAEGRHADEAEQLFQRAMTLDPDNAYTLAAVGRLEASRGEHERARALLGRALELGCDIPTLNRELKSYG